ncbi:MAG: glycosyltransferase family 2 protein [Candidatus Sumerlaeia bacterium]|nr:glycosyltransferase family 2 protein [Candidatus Sumerlaeia bacterium]
MSDATEPIDLSVVIPAYNEESRLPATIRAVEKYLADRGGAWELIVVDDGSRDGTVAAAEGAFSSPGSRVLRNPANMGKGASVKNGMLAARGRLRLFSDADLSTPIEEFEKLAKALEGGAQVAIGSRAMAESRLEKRQPIHRETMGRVFNLIVRAVALGGIKDTQCGFKLFTAEAARAVFPRQRLNGFSFDVETLVLARKLGFRIAEVPVRWIDSPNSRVSPVRDSLRMFADVVRIRFRREDD